MKSKFFGKAYFWDHNIYGRRIVGVIRGLGNTYIAGWIKKNGAHCRIKSPALPPGNDPEEVQQHLDAWAIGKSLEVAL